MSVAGLKQDCIGHFMTMIFMPRQGEHALCTKISG